MWLVQLKDALEIIFCLIFIGPIFLVFVVPVILLGFIYRLTVFLYLKGRFRDGSITLMSIGESLWAYETEASAATCHAIYTVEGNCDIERVRDTLLKAINNAQIVQGKLSSSITTVFGLPCWKRVDKELIDMKEQVRTVLDDKERGCPISEKELFEFVSKDYETLGKRDPVPWKVYLVPNIEVPNMDYQKGERYYAFVAKYHHCIMDGISGFHLVHSTLADKPFKFNMDPSFTLRSSLCQKLVLYFLAIISIPRTMLRTFLFMDQNYKKGVRAPPVTGPKLLSWGSPIPMETLKEIKSKSGTSLFSIFLSCMAGALKSQHQKNGESHEYPKDFPIFGAVALLPYPKSRRLCNNVSGMLIPATSGDEKTSRLERLRRNHTLVMEKGRFSSPVMAVSAVLCGRMNALLPVWSHGWIGMMATVKFVLTNLPGPNEEITVFGGHRVVDMGGWAPAKFRFGLGVCATSYANKVRASFVADKAYFPHEGDLEFLTNAFQQELYQLLDQLNVKHEGLEHIQLNIEE